MAYDQLGMSVGGVLQDLGTSMYRDKRAKAAYAEEMKAREAEAEAVEFEVRRAMRDASELVMPNGKTAVTWKERSGSWLDETALKEAHPKLAREFTRKWTRRVFNLKQFATEGI